MKYSTEKYQGKQFTNLRNCSISSTSMEYIRKIIPRKENSMGQHCGAVVGLGVSSVVVLAPDAASQL